ncbi:hypothetical protein VTN00DRAFT_5549 [Thermoascus crustaceus]|uniref:uncharacterized protein n=1 Tax=Thermoascus crustaceus TaxID=5088 RepID=UPI0037443D50
MARIKYTGPSQMIQMQRASTPHVVGTDIPKSAQKQRQGQTEANQQALAIQQAQALKQQQSQEMVQIMLHVSVSPSLSHIPVTSTEDGEFLPLSCFGDRDLKLAHREKSLSYEGFIHGKASANESDPKNQPAFGLGKRGQPLKVLIRNREPAADTILDLLEHGIFDALEKKVLEALQITVYLNKDAPKDVVESYTFSFKYTGGLGDVDSRLASVSLESTGCAADTADMKTMQTARLGLEMIIRRLITLSTFLPILPSKRYLEVHLLYTEDCPTEYEPPGFKRTTSGDSIRFPLNEFWCRESQSCGAMDSGYHTVGLKVTSLKWTGPERDALENPPQIPRHIGYTDTVLRTEEVGISVEDTIRNNALRAQSNSQESTQTRQDAAARQRLQKMIPTASSTPDSDLIPTQRLDLDVPFSVYGEMSQYYTAQQQVQLSQSKTSEIQELARSKAVDYIRETRNGDISTIRCQCSWNGEEPEMIECEFCHTRQHLLCYGFLGSNDPRLPNTHACYRCLLEPNETHLLRELNTLVLLRRALEIIIQEGYPNKISLFSQKLHCSGQTVIQVTDLLKKQGLLQATPGNKSKGFLEKGLPKYSIPQSDEIRERIRREIFDPLAKIEHHYIRAPIPESLANSEPFTTEKAAVPYPKETQSRSDDCRSNVKDMDELETRSSGDELMDLAEESRGRKRSLAASERGHIRDSEQHAQLDTEMSLFGRQHRSITNDKISTTSRRRSQTGDLTGNKATSPSDHAKEMIRRSPRKKRKMSNSVKLIDVGVMTTDEESL